MLKIAPETYRALEQDATRASDRLHRLWVHAGEQGRELGIDNDDDGRVSFYAAAFALIGQLDGIQFLRVSDVLFESGTRDKRSPLIAAIARDPVRAPVHG